MIGHAKTPNTIRQAGGRAGGWTAYIILLWCNPNPPPRSPSAPVPATSQQPRSPSAPVPATSDVGFFASITREGPYACVSFCCQGARLGGGRPPDGHRVAIGRGRERRGGKKGSSWQRKVHVATRVLAGYRPPPTPRVLRAKRRWCRVPSGVLPYSGQIARLPD